MGKFIKDISGETPDIETYLYAKDYISKYQLNIEINSRPLKKQIIEVSFDYRVETEALARIPNVDLVKNPHDFDYELHMTGIKDMRTAVFDFAHDNGLKILNLQLKNESLEALFNELTSH